METGSNGSARRCSISFVESEEDARRWKGLALLPVVGFFYPPECRRGIGSVWRIFQEIGPGT